MCRRASASIRSSSEQHDTDSYRHYALWLSGENVPDDNHGYANLTNWFQIVGKGNWTGGHQPSVLSDGAIAGLVVGIVVLVCCAAVAVFLVMRKRKAHRAKMAVLGEAYERETAEVGESSEPKKAMGELSA